MKLTKAERKWLAMLSNRPSGTWPDRPFLRDREASPGLMQKGLVEIVKPPSPYLSYVIITDAGRLALSEAEEGR